MKILDRYLTHEFIKVFFFALFGFTLLVTAFRIQELLKIDTDEDKIHIYLHLLYTMPRTIAEIAPASLLFGVCFSMAQLASNRELAAMQSAGVSFFRISAPLYIAGMLLTLFLFFFQNFIVAETNKAAQREMTLLKKNTGVVHGLIWQKNLRGKSGYYFLYFFNTQKLEIQGGFNYLEMRKGDSPRRMYQAARAIYDRKNRDWLLKNAVIVDFSEDMKTMKVEKSPNYRMRFPEDVNFFARPFRDPLELNVFELADEIDRRGKLGFSRKRYQVQLHASVAFPFLCIVLSLVGTIVGGRGAVRSSSPLIRSILISAATMFVYILAFNLGKNLGTGGVLPPWAAGWGPTVMFLFLSLYLLYKNRS